jgi:large subunit ribosomal protein L29
MKSLQELRALTIEELENEVVSLRKMQIQLRIQQANNALEKSHLIATVKRVIAQIKTIITEKVRNS